MGSLKMNNELLMDKNAQSIIKKEEHPCKRGTAPQNITVILPAYNEEVSIGSIVLLTRFYADNVIVVDDGSIDRTAEVAGKAGAEVIVHKANKGKGGALKTGFTAAANRGADIIVTMDSDGQHNPADIPKLVAPIIEGNADIVNGSRYLNGLGKNTPIYRRVGQTILDKFTNINSGIKITDSQSGFRAFEASTVDIFRFDAQGMAIESEMLADAGKAGIRIKEVEIGVRYDVDCSTKNPIQHGLEVFVMVLKDIEFNKPLYYFTVPGMSLGIGGLYMGAHFLQIFVMGGGLQFGPTMLMVLLIVIGTFMALTGILLHSVSTVMKNAREA
jgi:glycosyltransferase involved in cell wall biosynthesis